ncbi:Pr6Pr family membrane protein [Streptococcus porci]|uniref:Pr6Pr family membrane protein n=1 Tax=Streptococcus porci TaxID=502567 RepID=UPI0003FFF7F1|nr:Pr6Pr family membrane protein [Streptococcus porci]
MSKTQLYRLIIALCGLTGVTMQISQDGWNMLLYYTVLSNILVFVTLFFLIFWEQKVGTTNQFPTLLRLKGGVTMAIAITFIIYHFLLAPLVTDPQDYWNIRNFLVHYIAPLGLILDTLFLDKKNTYKLSDPIPWTSFPIAYFALAIFNGMVLKLPIPGATNSPYAYFFINVNKFGLTRVITNALVIAIAYLFVGYLLVLIKRFVGQRT